MGVNIPSAAAAGQPLTSKPQESFKIAGLKPVEGSNGIYVVHGANCGCSMSKTNTTTTLIGLTNTKINGVVRIIETETAPANFAAPFGICTTLTAQNNGVDTPCAMKNIPIWITTDTKSVSSAEKPTVTMSSFTICMAGGGVIVPLIDGQSMVEFDYKKFYDGLPPNLQPVFAGVAASATNVFGNDPVNMSTGNFVYFKNDLEILGRFPLLLKRFYNTMDNSDGVFGKNWTHNFNIFLMEENKNVKITFDDGHVEEYHYQKDGRYISPPEHLNTLTRSDDGYTLMLPSRQTYHFSSQGSLLSITDLNGNTTTFSHKNGLLCEVTNACGSLSFEYDKKGRIARIRDHTGRVVSYEYNENYLIAATYPSGAVCRYEYGENGKISNIISPLGINTIHNEYDEKNRTVKQSYPDGGFASTEYDDKQLCVVNIEQSGNRVIYEHDMAFRTTGIIYEDSEECFDYNENNKRVLYTDRNGNTWAYAYDNSGNLIKVTSPIGDVTQTEYNELNKPIKITAPNGGITSIKRDSKGNILKVVDPLLRKLLFKYDHRGLITETNLPDDSQNRIEYDERGNILAMLDNDGNRTQFEYDPLNRITQAMNSAEQPTRFEYNAKGDITKVTNAEGNSRRYEYNLSGKVTQITDFDGGMIRYSYTPMGKVEEIIDQMGGSTKFTYDLMWNITSVTDPNGNTARYVYDQYQRVIESYDEEGNKTSYAHDCKGNVTAILSPLGALTKIKYDALDRRHTVIDTNGAITKFSYDKSGNLATVTDALGNTVKREYDLASQLTSITDALGNKTEFEYTPLGKIERIVNAKGEARVFSYYPGGKLKSVTMPGGESEAYEYDAVGNVVKVADALGNETLLTYDVLNRVTEVTNPLGHSKKFGYDAVGNIISATDEKGNVTQYKYSLLGDIIEVIDAIGHSTKYGYDKARRLTKLEQFRLIDRHYAGVKIPEYQITTYERNKKGEVVAVNSPLNGLVRYGYDGVGNVTSKLDEDGLETLYEYNLVGKLQKVCYADGKTVEFGYNALRQLTVMKDWLGTTNIELDSLGRTVHVTDHDGKEIGYVWNAIGQREKLLYPDGSEVSYEYNPSGKLEKVLSESGATRYLYDAMGRMTTRLLPDETTTTYELNPLGRLTSLTHSKGGTVLDEFKYEYDPVGNIRQIDKYRAGMEADSGVFEYAYDPLNRLAGAMRNGVMNRYCYDELGNRTSEFHAGVETKHTFNTRNQLIKSQEGDEVTNYRYDKRGNMTEIIVDGLLKSQFDFDATNMMVGAFTEGKGQAEYAYNGFMKRVRKLETLQNPGEENGIPLDPVREIRYTLDATRPYNNLLATEGASNQKFAWGNGLISASGEDNFYYLQDHLGSPIRLMGEDETGTPLAYDEFGVPVVECVQNAQSKHNPFGFTGYQVDDVSGMYFAQARYYAPELGRFGAEDPHWNPGNMIYGDKAIRLKIKKFLPDTIAILQSAELYNYCINNPLVYTDIKGEKVTIQQDKNNITINVEFDIEDHTEGNFTTNIDGSSKETSYEDAFLDGISGSWSGTFGDYNVTTIATTSEDGIDVNLMDGLGISNVTRRGSWSDSNRGVLTMYQGDSRNASGTAYSLSKYQYVASHEFGHIMGIADAYGYEKSEDIISIMNKFGTPAQEKDIEMLLKAYTTGERQIWGDLGNKLEKAPFFEAVAACLD